MDLPTFKQSLDGDVPPEGLGQALAALWHEAKGDWDRAHRLAQAQKDADGAWVHAYLHRKEGDLGNASYWYSRSRQPVFEGSLEDEWSSLVETFLSAKD